MYQQMVDKAGGTYATHDAEAQAKQNQYDTMFNDRQSTDDFFNKYNTELGGDAARGTYENARNAVNLSQNLINNLPSSISGRTAGANVSEAMRQRMLGQEMSPLQQGYSNASQHFSDASDDYQNIMNQIYNRANMGYQGQENDLNRLQGDWNTLLNQRQSSYGQLMSAMGQKAANDAARAAEQRQYDWLKYLNQQEQDRLAAEKEANRDWLWNDNDGVMTKVYADENPELYKNIADYSGMTNYDTGAKTNNSGNITPNYIPQWASNAGESYLSSLAGMATNNPLISSGLNLGGQAVNWVKGMFGG
jgi:hypothetical protein